MAHITSEIDVGRDTAIQLKLYQQLADGLYVGPQGSHLQDFVELHCKETKNCHLGLHKKTIKLKWKGREIVKIVANKSTKGPYVNISECFELTEFGKQFLEHGLGGLDCVEFILRCKGSFHDGNDNTSGSNCQKYNRYNPNWCTNFGACAPSCGFRELVLPHLGSCPRSDPNRKYGKCSKDCSHPKSLINQRNKLLDHGCAFTVQITATLRDIDAGVRTIQVSLKN